VAGHFTRVCAQPSKFTFSIPLIGAWVKRHIDGKISVDPFAGEHPWATYTNDLSPARKGAKKMLADDFLAELATQGVQADVVLFDPPYSPRQITECYSEAGLKATMQDTQNAAFYKRCRRWIEEIVKPGGIVISFGWNSVGMGANWDRIETLLVCHGSAHNDTICVVDRKPERLL
jgi:hypothetical protein